MGKDACTDHAHIHIKTKEIFLLFVTFCLSSALFFFIQIGKDSLGLNCPVKQDLIRKSLQEGRYMERKTNVFALSRNSIQDFTAEGQ